MTTFLLSDNQGQTFFTPPMVEKEKRKAGTIYETAPSDGGTIAQKKHSDLYVDKNQVWAEFVSEGVFTGECLVVMQIIKSLK